MRSRGVRRGPEDSGARREAGPRNTKPFGTVRFGAKIKLNFIGSLIQPHSLARASLVGKPRRSTVLIRELKKEEHQWNRKVPIGKESNGHGERIIFIDFLFGHLPPVPFFCIALHRVRSNRIRSNRIECVRARSPQRAELNPAECIAVTTTIMVSKRNINHIHERSKAISSLVAALVLRRRSKGSPV